MALDFLAGCAGGVAGVLVGHPFDTVKVRLQVQNVEKPQYRGTLHCFQTIIKQESVSAWAGQLWGWGASLRVPPHRARCSGKAIRAPLRGRDCVS